MDYWYKSTNKQIQIPPEVLKKTKVNYEHNISNKKNKIPPKYNLDCRYYISKYLKQGKSY